MPTACQQQVVSPEIVRRDRRRRRGRAVGRLMCRTGLAVMVAAACGAWVYETDTEWLSSGDFDGDGLQDPVIVDKETGCYQIAYHDAGGTLIWSHPRASGVPAVEAISVGHLVGTDRDALAVTAAAANRIHMIEAPSASALLPPTAVFPAGIGPGLLVALDIDGEGNTPLDDLVTATRLNGAQRPTLRDMMRNDATGLHSLGLTNAFGVTRICLGNAAVVERGLPPWSAVLDIWEDPDGVAIRTDLRVSRPQMEPALPVFLDEIESGCRYLAGCFDDASPYSQFVLYWPGGTSLSVAPVVEVLPGRLVLADPTDYAMGAPIRRAYVVTRANRPALLITWEDDTPTRLYTFDGTQPPQAVQDLPAPPPDRSTTGVIPLAGTNFVLLSGSSASARSDRWQEFRFDGEAFVPGDAGELPGTRERSGTANVLLFDSEPLVNGAARRTAAYRAGDWTVGITNLPAHADVRYEVDAGPPRGLQDRSQVDLGEPPSASLFGLPNQVGDAFSVYSLDPAIGTIVSDVLIQPPAGHYGVAVQVTFTSDPPAVVYHRRGGDAWSTNVPFWCFEDTTVMYYGVIPSTGKRTTVQTAIYTFDEPPGGMDSDNDGVPDFVELNAGLDPVQSGADADGDGLLDDEELINGTNPLETDTDGDGLSDRREMELAEGRAQSARGFDWRVTPRPYDGVEQRITAAATGTAVRAYGTAGQLQSSAVTMTDAAMGEPPTNPAALLRNISLSLTPPLSVGATDPYFFTAPVESVVPDRPASSTFEGARRWRANLYICDRNAILTSHEFYLGRSTPGAVTLFVYADCDSINRFRRVAATNVTVTSGNGYVESGPVNLPLETGCRYIIGAGWDAAAEYAWRASAQPQDVPFGQSVSGIVLDHVYPPTGHVSMDDVTLTSNAYDQRLVTRPLLGRELLTVRTFPSPPAIVYSDTYTGGDLAEESAQWIAAARLAWSNFPPTVVANDLDHLDTLAAMLIERRIADLLQDRGEITTNRISLFPFRSGDSGLPTPSPDTLSSLHWHAGPAQPAYDLWQLVNVVHSSVRHPAATNQLALNRLATELYRVSSALHVATNSGAYRLPADVLRRFLAGDGMDPAYANAITLDAAEVDQASGGAMGILAAIAPRPREIFQLAVRSDSYAPGCATLWTVGDNQPVNLFDAQGQPIVFPNAFRFTPGTELQVDAYTDLPPAGCFDGAALEVIAMYLTTMPLASAEDANGNLLPDEWELLMFGGTGGDWQVDHDRDGYSDLQEYLDATDPLDAEHFAEGVAPADFSPPELEIRIVGQQGLELTWSWPVAYASAFIFSIESTDDLLRTFEHRLDANRGRVTVLVTGDMADASSRHFYRVGISLR